MSATELLTHEMEHARAAASGAAGKDAFVQKMFAEIAPRYDTLNHLLSWNLDRRWRRAAIAALQIERAPQGTYLDLCAGTLDVAVAIAALPGFGGRVVGADFAEPMLRAGAGKARGAPVAAVAADAQSLPVATASMSGAIVAFGIRNVGDLDRGLREMARVLAPGARAVILEFTTPPNRFVRVPFHLYFHHVVPRIGALVSGHRTAYSYLPASVAAFPDPPELAARMRAAGFASVEWRVMMLGVVALHVGTRGP